MRHLPLITDGVYHVYNRGVDKRKVFLRFGQYLRFINSTRTILYTGSATERLSHVQGSALNLKVSILSYCLMPNHYHFLIKQTDDNGISEFMQKLNTSYTMYFNLNLKRTGRLFEYTFKAKPVESDELLLHISRYMHINPVIAHLVEKPEHWRWSSYKDFLIPVANQPIVETQYILNQFNSSESFEKFTNDQIAYAHLLKRCEKQDEDKLFF